GRAGETRRSSSWGPNLRLLIPNRPGTFAALLAVGLIVSSSQPGAAQQMANSLPEGSTPDGVADPNSELGLAADSAPAAWDPLTQINYLRALAGVQPANIHPALAASAAGQVDSYDSNRGEASLVGMGI